MKYISALAIASTMMITPAAAQEPWKFPTLMSLTGAAAGYSEELKLGFELAREKINADGGIKGRPVELAPMDTQSNPGQVATLIRQACSNSLVVLGPALSNEARVAFPVANQMQCPAIAAAAAAVGLTAQNRPWTFAMLTPSNILTPAAVDEMVAATKPTKAVIFVEKSDPAAKDYASLSGEALKKHDIPVEEISVSSNDVDFGPAITRAMSSDPDLVVISSLDRAAVGVLKELRKTQSDKKVLLTQSSFNALVGALPPEILANVYRFTQSDPGSSSDPKAQEFVEKFKKASGGRAPSIVASLTYDVTMLTKDTLERSGVTGDPDKRDAERKSFIDALAATKDWNGIGGTFSMSPEGFMVKPPLLLVYNSGKWAPVND